MSIKGKDKEFRLPKITYIDFKHIEMDRVLTDLFPLLKHGGQRSSRRKPRHKDLDIHEFVQEFQQYDEKIVTAAKDLINDNQRYTQYQTTDQIEPTWFPDLNGHDREILRSLLQDLKLHSNQPEVWFRGFTSDTAYGILEKWIETDLMDIVNRGKPNQAIAAPRPLHGNTYKFRNPRHSRDYEASDQIYWMLYAARRGKGQFARDDLTAFFFTAVDLMTDKHDPHIMVDVETQALLRLDQQVIKDRVDEKKPNPFPPLCLAQADLLAEDVLRLLAYQNHIPRSVIVDYLKTLFAFHLALYHLRLMKLLPSLVRRRGQTPECGLDRCPIATSESDLFFHHSCPYRIALVVDMGNPNNSHMTDLAYRSADTHYRRIPHYIQSHFTVKKLDELATYLHQIGKLPAPTSGYFSIFDLLQLLQPTHSAERDAYFKARLASLVEETKSTQTDNVDPEIKRTIDMGLSDFETYIEVLVALRARFHRQYITEFLDSMLLKNSDAGLLQQSRSKPRHFVMGSRLLEVLLQIAVLRSQGSSYITQEIRVDELLSLLRKRYGLYIDRLPEYDGFGKPSIVDREAIRWNVESFKMRLREIGFFQDLSDAYLTQTVTPRYTIG